MKYKLLCIIILLLTSLSAKCDVKEYNIKDIFTITVDTKLELRDKNSIYSKEINSISNSGQQNKDVIVFQQAGLDLQKKTSYQTYARIMIRTDEDEEVFFPASDDMIELSDSDIILYNKLAYQELSKGLSMSIIPTTNFFSKDGLNFVRTYYQRTGYYGNIDVYIYYLYNANQMTKLIVSFKHNERDLWEDIMMNVVSSYRWIDPKIAHQLDMPEADVSTSVFENGPTKVEVKSNNEIINKLKHILYTLIFVIAILAFVTRSKRKREQLEIKKAKKKKVKFRQKIETINLQIEERNYHKADLSLNEICNDNHALDEGEFKTLYISSKKKINEQISKEALSILEKDNNTYEELENHLSKLDDVVDMSSLDEKTNYLIHNTRTKIIETLANGVITENELSQVYYELEDKDHSSKEKYLNITIPKFGTIIAPYRQKKINLRGYCEKSFENLVKYYLESQINIIGNASLLFADNTIPYEPDIALVDFTTGKNIRIDIEIDEPYSGYDRNPIHYIGCGDDYRDENLASRGWITVRFSERQIVDHGKECIYYIAMILSQLSDHFMIPEELVGYHLPKDEKRWTKVEATIFAASKIRENYLGHEFGKVEKDDITKSDFQQNALEKMAAEEAMPVFHPSITPINIDNSQLSFEQDNHISFIPYEHIYLLDGKQELTAVSHVISLFFEEFDSLYWATRKSTLEKDANHILEEWDIKGDRSQKVGTFMHEQIEKYLNGQQMSDNYRFIYNGPYSNIIEIISIQSELEQFRSFISENDIHPFRTEWQIYDKTTKIAGTVDLLCRIGNNFEMYDWKRTLKINQIEIPWRYGINGLENVPDTRYYHYCLQQNLYRYIIEANYGITIERMSLVVFHSDLETYKIFEVPRMDSEINYITQHLRFSSLKKAHTGSRINNKS